MKHTLHIQAVATLGPHTEISPERLAGWRQTMPAAAARRMTPLGLMLAAVTGPLLREEEEDVVYATSFSEVSSLEKYLDGFPVPSPLLFQTSIHPGGIEQVLVGKKIPVRKLIPLAGETALVCRAVHACRHSESVLLCGGEELGTWLGDLGAASPIAFAFALRAARDPSGAIGSITWSAAHGDANPAGLADWFEALRCRTNAVFAWPDAGTVELQWS